MGGGSGGGTAGGTGGGGPTAETFACADGVDNDGDQAIDCGDSDCTGRAACQNLSDGKPCLISDQCAGGQCFTEAATGYPNGHCTNLFPCTVGSGTGCNGGYCVNLGGRATCVAKCTSNIVFQTYSCRTGYTCQVPWNAIVGGVAFCTAACAGNADCSTTGPARGCNAQSKKCGLLAAGLLPYGSACSTGSQCESLRCATGTSFPNGACVGPCTSSLACGPGGTCFDEGDSYDSTSTCTQSCTTSATCRTADGYQCRPANFDGTKFACLTCQPTSTPCSFNSQCCSNRCVGYSNGNFCDD